MASSESAQEQRTATKRPSATLAEFIPPGLANQSALHTVSVEDLTKQLESRHKRLDGGVLRMSDDEDTALIPSVNVHGLPDGANGSLESSELCSSVRLFKCYKRRWYVLFVYSFAGMGQNYLWNMWGPVFKSMVIAYRWDRIQLALMPFYGNLALALLAMPSVLFLEKFGLRKTVLAMTFLTAAGTAIRCFPSEDRWVNELVMNTSAVIVGVPGIVSFFVPAHISARWFPTTERKLSTAVGILFSTLGIALAFIVGPSLVTAPSIPQGTSPSPVEIRRIKLEYHRYTYLESCFTLILFVVTVVYFPEKPPSPPSETAAEGRRVDYLEGCKRLLVSLEFWLLCVPITLIYGTWSGFWLPILELDLKGKNIDQIHAGWMGFYASISGMAVGIMSGMMGDRFGHLKAILLACSILCIEGAVWLLLVMRGFIPFGLYQTYAAVILLVSAGSALLPINCELAAEMCFPVDEAIVVGLMSVVSNIWACTASVILFFPVGTAWIDWFLPGCCIFALPFVALIQEKYRRSEVDQMSEFT